MTRSRLALFAVSTVALTLIAAIAAPKATARARVQDEKPFVSAASPVAAGEYLMVVASCHDCHTAGWTESKGNVPAAALLAGNPVGFYGPWGTTYGKNLRQIADRQTEDHWVEVMRTVDGGEGKLPMPWHDAAKFSDKDLRAMYQYTKSLGPQPLKLPRGTKPGVKPTTSYIDLTVRDSTGK
ncbi:MAG: cytochrome C [Gemmatimonadetes bacterium]|jgi:mono/diheme cytochrome c family protein|nr:cytochrome C [Gemmatimonadota bacterium]